MLFSDSMLRKTILSIDNGGGLLILWLNQIMRWHFNTDLISSGTFNSVLGKMEDFYVALAAFFLKTSIILTVTAFFILNTYIYFVFFCTSILLVKFLFL